MSDDEMREYREVFESEAAEFLQTMTDSLLALEAHPSNLAPVETLFRAAHSLKGMAGMMGYERTAELTHKMEGLMDALRQGRQLVEPALVDLMLRATDALRACIDDEMNERSADDADELIDAIAAVTLPAEDGEPAVAKPAERVESEAVQEATGNADGRVLRLRIVLDRESVLKSVRAYMTLKRLGGMGSVIETVPSAQALEDERFGNSFEVVFRTDESEEDVRRAVLGVTEVTDVEIETVAATPVELREGSTTGTETRPLHSPKLSETQTVRVSIQHLDKLVDLVGELVILRSRLVSMASKTRERDLHETLGDLHRVLAEMQHEVMQARMVPVGNIFRRFPRMVRDLAHDLGKDIEFEMDGLDIELDRTVLDEIGDPLLHLLRNSIDHGIETPEARRVRGKPERGSVRLSATREREQVRIAVTDDGKGIDAERVWAKAVKLGIADAANRDAYSVQDILALTCIPGFSTAEQTTKVSGRGVGMDVVKARIEQLGGTLTIHSTPGQGTEFVLTLPLTLAIIQALMLGEGERVFALPLSAVTEVLSPDELSLKTIDDNPVVVMRDDSIVPLIRLERVLGRSDEASDAARGYVVLLEMSGECRALAVPKVLGRQEIVIKPLAEVFQGIVGLGGAAVLGDGRIALILDPRGLFAEEMEESA